MNVLIVSDASDTSDLGAKVKSELTGFLRRYGHSVDVFDIRAKDMHCCAGCFGCWFKTPGECVVKDISRDINKSYIGSSIAIFASPVRYGCYTPAVRRVIDRMLPNVLPFFRKINGEVHHVPRYRRYPRFVAFGYGGDITGDEENTFRSLCDANAVNFQAGKTKTFIVRKETELEKELDSLGKYMKECGMQ